LTTFLFLLVSMTILGKAQRTVLVVLLSAVISFIGWAVFILAFDTRFPRGAFERFMEAMLSNG
jgi:hypothetical protein